MGLSRYRLYCQRQPIQLSAYLRNRAAILLSQPKLRVYLLSERVGFSRCNLRLVADVLYQNINDDYVAQAGYVGAHLRLEAVLTDSSRTDKSQQESAVVREVALQCLIR